MGQPDIFDELAEEIDVFDSVEEEDSSIETIKAELSTMLERFNESRRKADSVKFTQEMKALIKKEIARIKPIQNVIEKTLEKQVVKNIHVPVSLPPPPKEKPQIVREVRVEVLKDSDKYAQKEHVETLNKEIERLREENKQIKELNDAIAQIKETLPFVGMHGGPGVIGLPGMENQSGKILGNDGNKPIWTNNAADSSNTLYIGDPNTNGSWRFRIDGSNLLVERLASGTWTEESAFMGSTP
jgi:hypothetical protein